VFSSSLFKEVNLVIDENLNFTLSCKEMWGAILASPDVQVEFCLHQIKSTNLVDVDPDKLKPTRRNKRLGAVGLLKQLDHFLVVRGLLGSVVNFRSWIGTNGRS
jgi:hypothetical protein